MFEQKRFCIKCKQKEPPVETVLEANFNISEARWNRSDYTCDDCYKERQKRYHEKDNFGEYLMQQKQQAIDEFTEQWGDPAYKKTRELADRVVKIWDKYERRSPEKGLRRDWICEVIFDNLWNIDANGIVEDFFEEINKSKATRRYIKPILLEFVSNQRILGRLQAAYKDKARNRWAGVVDAIIRKYAGEHKMVARPPYEDPYTKEFIDNWYLLTTEPDRQKREEISVARIEAINRAIESEKRLTQREREELEKRKVSESPNKEVNERNE